MTVLNKIFNLIKTTIKPYQFGFIQSHSYIDDNKLREIKALLRCKDNNEKQSILSEFEEKFARLVGSGSATSFASGRMAFYALMKALDIGKDDEVILTAFTCAVMPNAVMRIGARPVYADVDKNTFGSSAVAILKVITNKTKLIVAQHSFGIPCDIDQIVDIARERGIFVVEDCAITLDSSFRGIKVGNWGDAAIFSTDHSKPLNTMIGGLLYTKNSGIYKKVSEVAKGNPALSFEHQKNLFDQLLFEKRCHVPNSYPRIKLNNYIRSLYSGFLSTKRMVFLENDYGSKQSQDQTYPYPASMPPFLALLGIFELERWNVERDRRRKIIFDYIDAFERSPYRKLVPEVYKDKTREIVPLRFIFLYKNLYGNISQKLSKYFDSDWIWFRKPIICAIEELESLGYSKGSCLVSEEICSIIFNLPCNIINGWEKEAICKVNQALRTH